MGVPTNNGLLRASRFRLPLDLPTDFSKIIQNIIQASSFIRLLGEPGEVWDRDLLFHTTQDRTVAEWEEDWYRSVVGRSARIRVAPSLRQKYSLELVARTTKIVRGGQVVKEIVEDFRR